MTASHRRPRRRVELRRGLVDLAKSALLLVAVPVAIARLWIVRPLPSHLFYKASLSSSSLWLHLVLLAVGLIWLAPAAHLVRDLFGAFFGNRRTTSSSWSARWAASIAALLIASSAGSIAAATVSRPPVTTAAPGTTSRGDQLLADADPRVVGTNECLADLAARLLGDADRWPELARANLGLRQVDGMHFVDANLLRPGWCVQSSAPHATAERTTPVSLHGATLAELSLIGLGILTSAGLARRVRLLRRAAASLRALGERFAPPDFEAGNLDAFLAPFAEGSLLDWIEVANRLLGSLTYANGAPEVLLVRAGSDAVEFVLAEERPAPLPFRSHHGGRFWSLPLDGDLESWRRRSEGATRHVAALVPVGEANDSVYLLALGAGRRLALDGDDEDVRRVLSGIVDALRVMPWAPELDVELLGIEPPPTSEQSYQFFSTTPATLEELAARATIEPPSRPPLVLAAPGTDPEVLNVVAPFAGVVASGGPGTAILRVAGEHGLLAPFALDLRLSAPGPEQQRRFELLLAEASRSPAMVDPAVLDPRHEGGSDATDELPAAEAVEVCLLAGRPDLRGAVTPPADRDLPRVVELVAFLALHRHGVSRSQLTTALFGRATLHGAPARLDVLLAAVRRTLGSDGEGRPRLQLVAGDHVRLGDDVSCDWERLRSALAAARHVSPHAAVSLLGEAFALLDGEGFARWLAYDWLVAEGLLEELRADVVDAAHQLATLALAGNDHDTAAHAIALGRALEPASEILARDQMVFAAERGDLPAAEQAYEELEIALGELGGNEPAPETRALFLRLGEDRPA